MLLAIFNFRIQSKNVQMQLYYLKIFSMPCLLVLEAISIMSTSEVIRV